MNPTERKQLNRRITVVAGLVVAMGVVVGIDNAQVYTLFPWIFVGVIGFGLTVCMIWSLEDKRAALAGLFTYTFGYVVPAFALLPLANSNIYVGVYAVILVLGVGLVATTIDQYRSWTATLGGLAVGAGLSTAVLYAL